MNKYKITYITFEDDYSSAIIYAYTIEEAKIKLKREYHDVALILNIDEQN
jgi:hypothetical protein